MAAKVFAKDRVTLTKVRVTLEGGEAPHFRASAKLKVLEFILGVEEAKNKGE